MKTLQSLFLSWIVAIAVSTSGTALAQGDKLEAQRSAVIKLRTHRAGQADETAAGLFVGKDQQNAYFITAYHAVGPNSQGLPVHSVELQFYATPQNFDAFVFDYFDEGLDLGVVRIAITTLPPELPQIARKDVTADIPIHIVGHPSAGNWSVWQGNVQNEMAPNGDVHHFTTSRDESLAGGYSGGPVFDFDGNFLGMHTSTITTYGIAAKSADIVIQLRAWRVPTNNLTDVSDADAIKKVLDVYADAYNRRDPNTLWKVWPSAPAGTKHAIENSFSSASSIKMTLQLNTPEIASDHASATVSGQYTEEFTPKSGNSQRSNGAIAFGLKKRGSDWVIISVK